MEEKLELYLRSMIANNGSDLHIKAGSNVRVRIDGALKILGNDIIDAESVVILTQEITTEDQYKELLERGSLDFSYNFTATVVLE